MQILSGPTHQIEVIATEGVSLTDTTFVASWAEISGVTIQNPEIVPQSQTGTISNISNAIMVPTPTPGNQNQVKYISVINSDNITHNYVIYFDVANTIIEIQVALAAGDQLFYVDSRGWYTLDSGGCLKTMVCGGGSGGATSGGFFGTGNTTQGSSGTFALSSQLFQGAGNVSVGFSNGSIVISGGTAAPSPVNFSAGTTSGNLGSVVFSNSNNISFGLNGSTITGSAHNQAASGANGSFSFQTLSFLSSNNVSFSTGALGGIIASAVINVSASTTSNNLSAITFSNANGITFGLNASTLTASYTVPTITNSSWTVSDNATSGTVARLAFTNLNGVTLSLSSGAGGSHTIVGSHNGLTTQTNQQMSMFATGNTTQSSSGTMNASSMIFRGSGVASVGISNGSVIVDVPSGGGGETRLTAFAVSNTTQSSSGTIPLSSLQFAGAGIASVGVSNGSVIVSVPSGGGAAERGGFCIPWQGSIATNAIENATFRVAPVHAAPLVMDRFKLFVSYSQATDSTCSGTISIWGQIFTKNASTLSNFASGSTTYGWTGPGTQSSSLYMQGVKAMTCPLSATLSDGNYWIGILMRTTSGGANASLSNVVVSQFSQSFKGAWGVASNASNQAHLGMGVFSATQSTSRGSIAFSDLTFGVSRNYLYMELVNGTL